MFYLLKRIDEKQFAVGDVVMVLADFSGVEAGTKGVVTNIYDGGMMVTWARLNTVETIRKRLQKGDTFLAAKGWLNDGFSREELKYLGVQTQGIISS